MVSKDQTRKKKSTFIDLIKNLVREVVRHHLRKPHPEYWIESRLLSRISKSEVILTDFLLRQHDPQSILTVGTPFVLKSLTSDWGNERIPVRTKKITEILHRIRNPDLEADF